MVRANCKRNTIFLLSLLSSYFIAKVAKLFLSPLICTLTSSEGDMIAGNH